MSCQPDNTPCDEEIQVLGDVSNPLRKNLRVSIADAHVGDISQVDPEREPNDGPAGACEQARQDVTPAEGTVAVPPGEGEEPLELLPILWRGGRVQTRLELIHRNKFLDLTALFIHNPARVSALSVQAWNKAHTCRRG
jgi:hypothetical protein